MTIEIGQMAPLFSLTSDEGAEISLSELKGKYVVLYFYPKDDTPGCTIEAQDFSKKNAEFEKLEAVILGISKDNVASHCKFIEKYKLSVSLLADENGEACKSYDVIKEKSDKINEFIDEMKELCKNTFISELDTLINEFIIKRQYNTDNKHLLLNNDNNEYSNSCLSIFIMKTFNKIYGISISAVEIRRLYSTYLQKEVKNGNITEEKHRIISEMMNHSYEENLKYAYNII